MDDAALVEACRAGDRRAQRALFEQHVEPIHRLILRMTRDEHLTADLVQDTFVRAFEAIGEFRARSSVSTWLHRIAVNETLQRFRHRTTEQTKLRELSLTTPVATEAGPAAEDSAASEVQAALGHLSDEHRLILILKYQQQMSYADIAGILDIPPGTIASRLNRARAELRRLLAPKPPEAEEETTGSAHPSTQTIIPEERQ